ncbi:hypothetical protein IHQ68_19145 [Chelatococcus sambhunathii]|uniref:DUF4430 domain-containing protein n=1 Tax=Chelatococcus sambhunathii TaxID=363953 RepID=A0ABU1DKV1_9HYPH|nr:hypothetical protein [Chelatococcus sambhunathii]MDR4308742.1 hypothetical protein [Chelatococcus sambhunathii]
MARRLVLAAAFALSAVPALAAPKTTVVMAKVGKTNVQVRMLLHPQVDQCSAPLSKELRAEATRLGAAHVRENLPKLIKKAGTDASGPSEFFGVSYLAGCPKDGSAWLAFPVEGKDKSVTRFQPGLGWSGMTKL